MFSVKQIRRQVIQLFQEQPHYRDDRHGTREYIIETYYNQYFSKSIRVACTLSDHIDRAFRWVQQRHKELRGETWLRRQRMAGEISAEEYEERQTLRDIYKQLKIIF